VDVANCGPLAFFLRTILRFPQAPLPQVHYGNAVHETLEWLHLITKKDGLLPSATAIKKTFAARLHAKQLSETDHALFLERGQLAFDAYLAQRVATVSPDAINEYNFRNEGVFVGKAHLGGKIDKLLIDKANKTITIVDYKTGKSHNRWSREVQLHKYRLQLYFYKLLVEGSHTYAGYTVNDAYLEFVEPDEQGIIQELHLMFDDAETAHIKKLIGAVWDKITSIDLPNTDAYSADLTGVEAFEADLTKD
jgi:DNA helicase-2/ATP-dependent DNA helicase PcrA